MVMYDNEYKTKENKNWNKDKIKPQYIIFTEVVIYLNVDIRFTRIQEAPITNLEKRIKCSEC